MYRPDNVPPISWDLAWVSIASQAVPVSYEDYNERQKHYAQMKRHVSNNSQCQRANYWNIVEHKDWDTSFGTLSMQAAEFR